MNFSAGKKRERRLYENAALLAIRRERIIGLLWTRRGRKSTTLGNIAFDELSAAPGRTVIAASASLLLGTELVSQAVTATEQAITVGREAVAIRDTLSAGADGKGLDLKCADSESGKVYRNMSDEDFADLYKSKKLELRLHFSRDVYSRLIVIAPNPATARGWGGTVLRDEVGYTHANLERELQAAVDPIFRTDPTFKMIYASNLPTDDRHPWFEMTLPGPDAKFDPNAQGHFYRGQHGILIHRVSLSDAYAAGHVLFDNIGKPMTLQEFRHDPAVRGQLPFSYDLIHTAGGAAAIDLVAMQNAQTAGTNCCSFVSVDSDEEFLRGLKLLRAHLGNGDVGIGIDLASTTSETSNPTSVTVSERVGVQRFRRLIIIWKSSKSAVHLERYGGIVDAVRERGKPPRRVCIDASNDRLFADSVRNYLMGRSAVELVIAGASVLPQPAGIDAPINYKTHLGDRYAASINDGLSPLPSDPYIKRDHRLVIKDRGQYKCEPEPDGAHGDTFDSGKLSDWALESSGGALENTQGIVVGQQQFTPAKYFRN